MKTTHIFDIDGTLVYYHTNTWLPGALDMLKKLYNDGHRIIIITMRGEQDNYKEWSVDNTKKTILKDLTEVGVSVTCIFGCYSPRVIHDDTKCILDERITNQMWV